MQQSYPLIGLDKNRNEYSFEHEGSSPANAAERGGKLHGYLEVLNGDRSHTSDRIHYKKSLWKHPMRDQLMRDCGSPTLGDFMPKSSEDPIKSLVDEFIAEGIKLSVVEEVDDDGDTSRLRLRAQQPITIPDERWDKELRPEIERNASRIIRYLSKQSAQLEEADLFHGQTREEVLKKILPQMPLEFSREDFARRLREANYIRFATEPYAVGNALQRAKKLGYIDTVARGVYVVTPLLRAHKSKGVGHTEDSESTPHEEPAQAIAKPETAAADKEQASVIAIQEIGRQYAEIAQASPAITVATPIVAIDPATLVSLLIQGLAREDGGSELAARMEQALKTFQNRVLEAADELAKPLMEAIGSIRQEDQARGALRALLQSKR